MTFALPVIGSASDAATAMGAILTAVSEGELTPVETAGVLKLVESSVRALEAAEFEQRLSAPEAKGQQ